MSVSRLCARFVSVTMLLLWSGLAPAAFAQTMDRDGDGLPDAWEETWGLDPDTAESPNGGADDPDGDGLSNAAEYAAGSHPRGFVTRRLAEGANNAFFLWRLALSNPHSNPAHVLVRCLDADGRTQSLPVTLRGGSQRTVATQELGPLTDSFSTIVESDVEIGVDRTMWWLDAIGSHTESSVGAPARRWFLAEGATGGGFSLFYLLQNPNDEPVAVTIRFLRPAPAEPIVRVYPIAPRSRATVWVDEVTGELAATDVSADISASAPIVVERAMYLDAGGVLFRGGHDSAGVTATATEWFLAEGATGPFFELFVLIANPSASDADVLVSYLLPDGRVLEKPHPVAPRSRHTIWVDRDLPDLANTPVSVRVSSRNGVGIVAERTMWWPDGDWREGHNAPGSTRTSTRWLTGDGEVGGGSHISTYVLVANTSSVPATVRATLLFEDATRAMRTYTMPATSRLNIGISDEFPEADGRRFAVLVESLGVTPAQLVVERSVYASPGGILWEAGSNALAMPLSSPLLALPDVTLFRNEVLPAMTALTPGTLGQGQTVTASSSSPGVATVTFDPITRQLEFEAGPSPGTTTISVVLQEPGMPPVAQAFTLTRLAADTVRFGSPVVLGSQLFPAFADFDDDNLPELAGTARSAGGTLVLRDLAEIGLGPVVELSATARNRDNRIADFNRDGRLDLVTHTYTTIDDLSAVARLFLGQPDGRFVESAAFTALDIRGRGETIVAADFDNDGDLDLFLPQYTNADPREHFRLLLNDGSGTFTDVADAAGVATRGVPLHLRVEGAQALDFDADGDLDLFAASHFYFNEGVVDGIPRFVDRREALGLPERFDEGIKFLDADNDGRLDLLHHHPGLGPQLWRFDGTRFTQWPLPVATYTDSFGANVYDLNGDGFEDIMLAPGRATQTHILLNSGGSFVLNPPTSLDGVGGDVIAFGDIDGDGRIDLGRRAGAGLQYALNDTPHTGTTTTVLEIVGPGGERNQFGRVARITPEAAPSVTYTRIVDGGSGFMAQNQYPLLVTSPFTGRYTVSVRFAEGERTFEVTAGTRVRLFPDGSASSF